MAARRTWPTSRQPTAPCRAFFHSRRPSTSWYRGLGNSRRPDEDREPPPRSGWRLLYRRGMTIPRWVGLRSVVSSSLVGLALAALAFGAYSAGAEGIRASPTYRAEVV